ncbi:T9SS type A sorting domain-containing protein [Flexithrix dorotheae]|uniref:T9SS type A sorting domain-containing protein n=1 Tax=Flexithrix dorotheae TaxID=70993 RepID=UPI00036001E9|nr:T9SS type A sorting domain-containing protein [Flexithrix dorotheae]
MRKTILSAIFITIFAFVGFAEEMENPDQWNSEKLWESKEITISNIYPNPAVDYAIFDYSVLESNSNVRIILRNLIGSEVASFSLSGNESQLKISLTDFSAGVYFYTLSIDDKSLVTKKFIVSK